MRSFFATFGVPEELSSDGGPEFTAEKTQDFLKRWGVKHRQSSAYHPQCNGRAEVAVKATKRLMRANLGPTGTLDSDRFLRAMLQLRNTPDPDCDLSPAQIIFGRPIRDSLSFANRLEKFSNPHIRPVWREAWTKKEESLRIRFTKTAEKLNEHSRSLPRLNVGDKCFIQNQTGNNRTKWDRTGTVVDTRDHDQYLNKLDGSGRLTLRNRRFLRTYTPASSSINGPINIAPSGQVETSECPAGNETVTHDSRSPTPTFITPSESLENPSVGEAMPTIDSATEARSPQTRNIVTHPTSDDIPPPTIRVPAMLTRLFPFNAPGKIEDTGELRRSRRGLLSS